MTDTPTTVVAKASELAMYHAVRARQPESTAFQAIASLLDTAELDVQTLRRALVTALRMEHGEVKTAQHHKDAGKEAKHASRVQAYSNMIARIDRK